MLLNFHIQIQANGYGQIESFIQHYDSSCTTVSALVRVFDCSIPFKTDVPTDDYMKLRKQKH